MREAALRGDALTVLTVIPAQVSPWTRRPLTMPGEAAQALIDASRTADLLAIGSRGAGGFEAPLQGSISSQVVQHTACPVVTVPSGR
jgi:hypothetical protein